MLESETQKRLEQTCKFLERTGYKRVHFLDDSMAKGDALAVIMPWLGTDTFMISSVTQLDRTKSRLVHQIHLSKRYHTVTLTEEGRISYLTQFGSLHPDVIREDDLRDNRVRVYRISQGNRLIDDALSHDRNAT